MRWAAHIGFQWLTQVCLLNGVSCSLGWSGTGYTAEGNLELLILLPSLPKCWVYVMLGMEPRAACVVGQDCTSWAARAAEFTRALRHFLLQPFKADVDTVFKPVSDRELTLFGTVVSVLCLNVHHSSFILTEPNSKVHLFCFSVQFQENFSKWNMYLAFIL